MPLWEGPRLSGHLAAVVAVIRQPRLRFLAARQVAHLAMSQVARRASQAGH